VNRSTKLFISGLLAMALLTLPGTAKDKKTLEQYTAMIAVTGGMASGATALLDIWIDEFTSDEEVVASAALLKEKGMDALRRDLEKKDFGRASTRNSGPVPIAIARSLTNGKNRIIRLFFARNIGFVETVSLVRSRDYPFSIIELVLDDKGTGQGTAIGAAQIRYDAKAKQFVVESLGQGSSAVKLMGVRKL